MRALAVLLLLLAGCVPAPDAPPAAAGPAGAERGPWREQTHWVPMRDARGRTHLLQTRICRPSGDRPARVVLINHGSPARGSERASRRPLSCEGEAARWFLDRGFVVVAGMRRGHGGSGDELAETSGGCGAAEFVRAGLESARDLDALVNYAAALPYAWPNAMVMVGQSTGGWATIGYNSVAHPRVTAMVNMAGGRGGHYQLMPNNNCRPDQLVLAAGTLGRTATTPMLWVYTENDSSFGPALATAMHQAFTRAGGKAEMVRLPAFTEDGHTLFFGRGGSSIWGPVVERYLAGRR